MKLQRMNIRVLGLIGCIVWASLGHAQGFGDILSGDKSAEKMFGGESLEKQMQQLQIPKETGSLFSDSRVDPKAYHLGPYDALLLSIWQPINQMALLTVTPEGKLVVPRVGEFNTVNKTLDSVRNEVIGKLQARMKGTIEASLALYKPRNVLVQVLGEVRQPGSYVLTATSRAGMAIQLASVPPKDATAQSMVEAERQIEKQDRENERKQYFGALGSVAFSLRHIVLRHNDGTSDNVDLQKYQATHDERLNPMLREGDAIYCSPKRMDRGQIAIYGAVRQPGVYEYVEGDSLSTLIAMAFGPTENADLIHATLQHSDAQGHVTSAEPLNLAEILAKRAPDLLLRAGDGVVVGEIVMRSEFGAVSVKGEAVHPSIYGIARGKTKLSEVMQHAGMFTSEANIAAGYVLRRLTAPDGQDLDLRESTLRSYMYSPLTLEDTLNFNLQSRLRKGTVVVDFRRLFIDGDMSADVSLEDGDEIVVPRNTNQVYVYGQVYRPGFVAYVAGKSADYYVDRAGGAEESAVPKKTGVIKSTTHTWASADVARVEPGDAIFVPKISDISASVREQSTGNLFLAASVIAALAGIVVNYILFHK